MSRERDPDSALAASLHVDEGELGPVAARFHGDDVLLVLGASDELEVTTVRRTSRGRPDVETRCGPESQHRPGTR